MACAKCRLLPKIESPTHISLEIEQKTVSSKKKTELAQDKSMITGFILSDAHTSSCLMRRFIIRLTQSII